MKGIEFAMNANARVTLAIRNFFKKYGRIILIIFLVWLVIFLANIYLKNKPKKLEAKSTYKPNEPIINEESTIPKKVVEKVNSVIEEYFNYCNSKEYEKAFNMLTEDCKEYIYRKNINEFKNYIDRIFTNHKIYNIQNYSNVENNYIYDIKILDDITATGTTGNYETYKEKIILHNENDEIKISNQGYIGKTLISKENEDDNIKVKVIKKEMSYAREEYTLEVRNKTDSYIMLSDDLGTDQITLNLGNQKRAALNTTNANIVVLPGETKEITLLFNKYYDDEANPVEINFNEVRIMSRLSSEETNKQNKDSLLRNYIFNVNLQ